jgi:hypothetical protein
MLRATFRPELLFGALVFIRTAHHFAPAPRLLLDHRHEIDPDESTDRITGSLAGLCLPVAAPGSSTRPAFPDSRVTARYLSMSSAETLDEHHQAVVVVSLLADVSEPAGAVADGGAEGAPLDRAANFAFCDFMNSR